MCRARAMETSEAPLRQASSTFGTCSSGITYLGWPGPLPASTAVDPRCSAQCSLSWLALNALFPLDFHYQDLLINDQRRSEEHTSELQSLMRISYAVFCLKKKKRHELHYRTTL